MLQEPDVLYALPEDHLAAWFYMHALVCANPHMIPWMSGQLKNAGKAFLLGILTVNSRRFQIGKHVIGQDAMDTAYSGRCCTFIEHVH